MITLGEKIAKTERLLQRLEEDQPYMRVRLSVLGDEHRRSANAFADRIRAEAEAELKRLLAERGLPLERDSARQLKDKVSRLSEA